MSDREPVQIVEIDIDYCSLTYGTGACTAVLGTTGVRKCYNTFATCQATAAFDKVPLTLRFANTRSNFPKGQTYFPVLQSVSAFSSSVNIAGSNPKLGDLGKRAKVTASLVDFPYHDTYTDKYQAERVSGAAQTDEGGYDPMDRGTFFTKLKNRFPYYAGRPMRVIDGYISGGQLVDTQTRHFIVTDIKGPDSSGRVTVEGKDVLTLADKKSAVAPTPSRGALETDITDTDTTFNLIPASVGAEYPSSGCAVIGSEIVSYTRSGDAITLTGRGLKGTEASSHNVDDTFQEAINYEDEYLDDVIYDLLVNYAGIPSNYIDKGNWNVSTATFVQSFSVAAQESSPEDIFFKPDGTKMYVLGSIGDDVNEYSLSTAWDVSTASYVQSFSVATQETSPNGLFFKPDGSRMYITGSSGDDVNEYSLSTAWDVSTASYVQSFSVSTQETTPESIFFSPDGIKMYIMGLSGDDINEYDLSTAWDISTATYAQNFSVSAQESSPTGMFFKPDGSRLYVIGSSGDDVNEYSLSADWNISTANFVQSFSVSTQETIPLGLFFKPDGSKMYVIGGSGDDVNEYDLKGVWEQEVQRWGPTKKIFTTITEPTGVAELVGELAVIGVSIWWDDVNQKIGLRLTKPPSPFETITEFNDDAHIKDISQEDRDEDRLTQVHFYHVQSDPTQGVKEKSNYDRIRATIDAVAEQANSYNDTRVREIFFRWFNTGNDTQARLSSIRLLQRLRSSPKSFTITLDAKDRDIGLTDVIRVTSRVITDDTGKAEPTLLQVTQRVEKQSGHEVQISAQSYQYDGKYGWIMEDTANVYGSATATEKATGAYIVNGTTLVFPDGAGPYLII